MADMVRATRGGVGLMVRAAAGGAGQWCSATQLLLKGQGSIPDDIRGWCRGHVAG